MSIPYQIAAIQEQLGRGINGALVYVGASQLLYNCKHETGGATSTVTPEGLIDAPVSLTFKVNGKKGSNWKIIVSLEPSDTYTVRLWKASRISTKRSWELREAGQVAPVGVILETVEGVYCDMLKDVVEGIYDRAIKTLNDGFIPLG